MGYNASMRQEKRPFDRTTIHDGKEIEPADLQGFIYAFINRFDAVPIQLQNGTYTVRRTSLSPTLITHHLWGEVTIGAYALNEQSEGKWICIDADDEQQWQQLLLLVAGLEQEGFRAYSELSRRGGHVWLFFAQVLPGDYLRRFGLRLLEKYNLSSCELYPKQVEQHGKMLGSFVRLPFGVHRKTGRRYGFVDRYGQALAPSIREQLHILSQPSYIPLQFLVQVMTERKSVVIEQPQPVASVTPIEQPQQYPDPLPLSERIKKIVSITRLVADCGIEVDQGNKGHCPFHDDEHVSFQVFPETNTWHCYAGCKGQTVIDFWILWLERSGSDSTFKAAIKDLAKKYLPPLPSQERPRKRQQKKKKPRLKQ